MKKFLVILCVVFFLLVACGPVSVNDAEVQQQKAGNMAILNNQPMPDLGGYSLERQIVIETYLARNNAIATYAYMISMDGKIIEICPSIGYPIPYSTQLSNPDKIDYTGGGPAVLANAEPNGLYPPGDAAATLVQCVNDDGSVSPVYIEWYVLAFPFPIQSDLQLKRIGGTSFSVDLNK